MSSKTVVKKAQRHMTYLWRKHIQGVSIQNPPVWIVGCGHSGTSLLLAVLGHHSRLHAVPFESNVATKGCRLDFVNQMKVFDRMAITEGKTRWIEKTPMHIRHIREILEWAPTSKILVCLRDGRDVAYSIKARTGNLEEGARRWVSDNQAGREFFQHDQVHIVKYEEIVEGFEDAIRGVMDFLGESYEDDLRHYHQTPRTWYAPVIEEASSPRGKDHGKHRNWQINQPIFDGRGRWKELTSEELEVVMSITGVMLTDFGYVASTE